VSAIPETLSGLLRHYSPSGQERGAVEYLVSRMQTLGYGRAFSDAAGNAVGILGAGERQMVLLGHIDTVPGEIPLRLEAGERLYGRGAVDAKGPLAAFVDAAAQAGPQVGWEIVVIGAVGEESESEGARFVASRYHPDFAIIGEPSRWERITLGYKGSAWAEINTRRPLAHSAGQQESASEAAFATWSRLVAWAEEFNAGRSRAFDQLLLSLRGLASGDDGFEEWASLRLGARLPADLDPPSWYTRLAQLAGQEQVQPRGYAVPAYRAEKNTHLVRLLLAGIRAAGGQPGFVVKTGTADLNIVAPAWGCPAVAYGPGDSILDHTPEEHIELEEYRRAVQVLTHVLTHLPD